jgi:arsenate reductase
MTKSKVLFLCTGNSARSQMAEAFLRAYAGEHFDVYSAGTKPKGQIFPLVLEVMNEIGISMEGQYSKSVNEYLGKINFGYTVTVCGQAEEECPRIFLSMGHHMFWPFDDPAAITGTDEQSLEKVRAIRDQIGEKVHSWLVEKGIEPATIA